MRSAADVVAALHRAPVRQLSDYIEGFVSTGAPVTRAMFAALGHRWLKSAQAAEPFPGRALFDGLYRAAPEPLRMSALVCMLRVLEEAPVTDSVILQARAAFIDQIDATQKMLALAGQLVYSGSSINCP